MIHDTVLVAVSDLAPHPRNYKEHPDDQLEHICASIRENGVFKNIVVAADNTILAGHGVVLACRKMGIEDVPVVRLDVDPDDPRALKVLAADNEVSKLGVVDDRALSELLKEVKEYDVTGLLGTGYDERMLANLVYVTRPSHELEDFDAAAHWVGLPDYEAGERLHKIIISFDTKEERDAYLDEHFSDVVQTGRGVVAALRYPFQSARNDWSSVKYEVEDEDDVE